MLGNSNVHSQFRTTDIEVKNMKDLCKDIHLHPQLEVCKLEPFLTCQVNIKYNIFCRLGCGQAYILIADLNADCYNHFGMEFDNNKNTFIF